MPSKTFEHMIGTSINTISGEAFYTHTEIEDTNGRWNDNYFTSDGAYLMHSGNCHHVYIVRK